MKALSINPSAIAVFENCVGLTSGNVTCSFETGFCGWNVTTDSNFKWLINTGKTGDRTSGLESDHTCGKTPLYTFLVVIGLLKNKRGL
ncbi:hypothetical protein CHS0354_038290 [Potamilus streckersoni]|uniref:MAM domain-containing protein n=1 Tax=Potamilus streckersoni TaxID=2493646 RepID=A0AAE0WAW9_9BIVA|nr:hypothetical protein CHS0354_038290 [Potamilus streckersoni]